MNTNNPILYRMAIAKAMAKDSKSPVQLTITDSAGKVIAQGKVGQV